MLKGMARKRLLEFVLLFFSVLYGYASSSVTEGVPKYWLALRARRQVTDAAWSGLASGIWCVVHPRAITGGCVGGVFA